MKETLRRLLPFAFVAILALARWPKLFPPDFSPIYGVAFCAGAYLPGRMGWVLPLGTMLATDLVLNVFFYHAPAAGLFYLAPNYALYAGIIWFGRVIGARAAFLKLLAGGVLGSVVFYLVTNTMSWLMIPGYPKTVAGWIQALTIGLPGIHPTSWEMFRNTLSSGGLFTALVVAAEKWAAAGAESPADKTAGPREPAEDGPEEETAAGKVF
ncbi:MAG: hypothetical protein KGR98_07200 [Verrucomicrobia bacterium]|nr:hypothetical protein [Verrucomicrobiota bacterium]MDE3099027.1 hypothetical protein [Verrucomicrobiota bacterium]